MSGMVDAPSSFTLREASRSDKHLEDPMERGKHTPADATITDASTPGARLDNLPAPRVHLILPIIDEQGPSPAEVRRSILREHGEIRAILVQLEAEATKLLAMAVQNEALRGHTRDLALTLCEVMAKHVARENALLYPVLTELDAWGPVRARHLIDDHREQMMLLEAYADMLRSTDITAQALAVTAWQLVRSVYADMEEEEATILSADLLADDGIGQEVEVG